jgi:hypothetical protein
MPCYVVTVSRSIATNVAGLISLSYMLHAFSVGWVVSEEDVKFYLKIYVIDAGKNGFKAHSDSESRLLEAFPRPISAGP